MTRCHNNRIEKGGTSSKETEAGTLYPASAKKELARWKVVFPHETVYYGIWTDANE
jgi:hypothetical protein